MAENNKQARAPDTTQKKKNPIKKIGSHWFRNLFRFLGWRFVYVFQLSGVSDYNVRQQFEGKRWAIPARFMPVRLSFMAGYALSPENFERYLKMWGVHYRRIQIIRRRNVF